MTADLPVQDLIAEALYDHQVGDDHGHCECSWSSGQCRPIDRTFSHVAAAVVAAIQGAGYAIVTRDDVHAEPILTDWTRRYWRRHDSALPMLAVTIEDYRERLVKQLWQEDPA